MTLDSPYLAQNNRLLRNKMLNLFQLQFGRHCERITEIASGIYLIKKLRTKVGEFKHEVRQFQKPYDNQQAEQTSLMV